MIKQLSLAVLLGCITTLFLAQFDTWVHDRISTIVLTIFKQSFGCDAHGTVVACRLFPLTITLKNLTIASSNKDQDWSWNAATFVMEFSWWSLLRGIITTSISIDNLNAYSGISDEKLAIFPHICDLIRGPKSAPLPLLLKAVAMRTAGVTIYNGLYTRFYWHGESRRIGSQFCSQFYIYDGSIMTEQKTILTKNISGSVSIQTVEKQGAIIPTIRLDGRGELPQLGDYPLCFITGRWFDQQGRFQIQSIDNSLLVQPLIVAQRENRFHIDATITAPLSYISKIGLDFDPKIKGTVRTHVQTDLHLLGNGECHIIAEDIEHPLLATPARIQSTIIKRGLSFEGQGDMHAAKQWAWHSNFTWDGATQKGMASCTNTIPMHMEWQPWVIAARALSLKCIYDTQAREVEVVLTGTATHTTKDKIIELWGIGSVDQACHMKAEAFLGDYRGILDARYDSKPHIECLKLFNKKRRTLIDCCYQEQQDAYSGCIDVALLRLLCDTFFHYDVHSEGMLLFNARQKNTSLLADIQLKNATVRLPQTLNFMQDCTASCMIDLVKKQMTVKNVRGALHTGTFYIPKALIQLDPHGNLAFLHVPLLIDRCLFTMKPDLFAMVSGSLLLQKRYDDDAQLAGNIILERSQLKENLFAAVVQKKLFQFSDVAKIMPPLPLRCDLTLETKEPIRVDTNFLEANAHVSLRVSHSLTQPTIVGSILVPSGSIRFPYKPLQITKGEITFFPEQSLNPLIEIIAKNNIKNHNVTLHVTGSLQDHMVMLESAPPLTEEQIVGLLLAGAHEESLQAIIPSLLMQNVTNYIFSSHKSNFFDRYIKPWMKKINVQLKPHFNEQSGRGGLRGALEITVNERWRALIEKNFTLTEDTRFELEYILSDDITFRLVRDERCDIGAEVEMKWKF